jgi:hypothetical protein
MRYVFAGTLICAVWFLAPLEAPPAYGGSAVARATMTVTKAVQIDARSGSERLFQRGSILEEGDALPEGVIPLEHDASTDNANQEKKVPKIQVLSRVNVQGAAGDTYKLVLPEVIVRERESHESFRKIMDSSLRTPPRQVSGVISKENQSSNIFVLPLGARHEFADQSTYRIKFQSTVVY